MKRYLVLLLLVALCAVSCGYRLGGLRKASMKGLNTYSVDMFANQTLYSDVAMQITTAVADSMQRDGTFRLASPEECDFRVSGTVESVNAVGLRTNAGDTYLSSEIGLIVYVRFQITNSRTGKVIYSSRVSAEGSFFNDTTGNIQTARDSALSYATRRAADLIVQALTLP